MRITDKSKFKWQDDLVKNLADKYKLDKRIIEHIVYSPLKFTKRRMEDENDQRPIRLRYFGVFVQKPLVNKESYNIARANKMMKEIRYCPYTKAKLQELIDAKDYDKIRKAYIVWKHKKRII